MSLWSLPICRTWSSRIQRHGRRGPARLCSSNTDPELSCCSWLRSPLVMRKEGAASHPPKNRYVVAEHVPHDYLAPLVETGVARGVCAVVGAATVYVLDATRVAGKKRDRAPKIFEMPRDVE